MTPFNAHQRLLLLRKYKQKENLVVRVYSETGYIWKRFSKETKGKDLDCGGYRQYDKRKPIYRVSSGRTKHLQPPTILLLFAARRYFLSLLVY
jgi:hypothetical protein